MSVILILVYISYNLLEKCEQILMSLFRSPIGLARFAYQCPVSYEAPTVLQIAKLFQFLYVQVYLNLSHCLNYLL